MRKSLPAFLCTLAALSLASCGTPAAVQSETEQSATAEAAEITETETTTTAVKTTTTTEETTTVTETEKVCTCESEFKHFCCEFLGNHFLAGGVYYGDINGDDKPEAVVETNPYEYTYVLYENENGMQVLELPTISDRGHVRYITDTKQILFNPQRDSSWRIWGYEEYRIYGWNGTDYEEISSVYREPGYYDGEYGEYGQAYIDGEEVDNDTFEVKLAEMEKLIDENEYFPVVRSLSGNGNLERYILENFPCFDNWEDCFPVWEPIIVT
ncbi:MAG: hypothetical protein K2G04_11290 [Oscillospiraceae bacterium]|nr:hypothetical protein [Oscillospiraceae bacterium]